MQNTIVSLTVFRYFIFAGKSITFKRNYSGHSSSSNKRPTKRSINADFSHKSCFSMWAHDSRLWDKVLTLEMFSSPPNVHQQDQRTVATTDHKLFNTQPPRKIFFTASLSRRFLPVSSINMPPILKT